jgi:hypothetical protein
MITEYNFKPALALPFQYDHAKIDGSVRAKTQDYSLKNVLM